MENQNSAKSSGNFLGTLGLIFVVLKLTGLIDWSWWWVTLPFWGGFALALIIILVFKIIHLLKN